jgi:hypothetical protein
MPWMRVGDSGARRTTRRPRGGGRRHASCAAANHDRWSRRGEDDCDDDAEYDAGQRRYHIGGVISSCLERGRGGGRGSCFGRP